MKYIFFLLILFTCAQSCTKNQIPPVSGTALTEWNEAPHNAFTDLIKFQNVYYCAFREASGHDSLDGKIRVIRSFDSQKWEAFTLILPQTGEDFRDAHFYVDNDDVLSVAIHSRFRNGVAKNHFYKLNNGQFEQFPNPLTDNDYWLWNFAVYKNQLYSIGYNIKQVCFSSASSQKLKIALFQSTNPGFTDFTSNISTNWITDDFLCPSEASFVFTPDSSLIAIIRDGATQGASHIGVSKYPYNNWTWQQFPYFVRGPKLVLLPDGKIFLGAGSMVNYNNTYYAILNPNTFEVEKLRVFPSGGDNGYPGVIIEGNTALISYYSSHEGNARVYIERITY